MSIPAHLLQRVTPTTPLCRLALTPGSLQQLQTIATDIQDAPPISTAALFVASDRDSPGLAAEALAQTLHRSVLRLDLAGLVSELPGETAATIDQILSTAHPGQSILFFDEADSLFSQRSEVNDSNDPYANMEINDLLLRLQSFPGLSILGTSSITNPTAGSLIRYTVHLPQPIPGKVEA